MEWGSQLPQNTHGQGGTYNWHTVNKMKSEGIQSNSIWPESTSGRLFAFAVGDEIHPGFCYHDKEN